MLEESAVCHVVTAILAAPYTGPVIPEAGIQHLLAGHRTHDGAVQRQLWQRNPEGPAKHRRPGARRTKHHGCPDRTVLGDHGRHTSTLCSDTAHGASSKNRCALACSRPRDRRSRLVRLGLAIAGRVGSARPPACRTRRQLCNFIAGDEARVETMLPCRRQPFRVFLEFLFGSCGIQAPGLLEPDVFSNLVGKPAPDVQTFHDHRHLARIPTMLSHPSPVAARLLARNMAFLAQDDVDAVFRQEPSSRCTDNAAANNHDVC